MPNRVVEPARPLSESSVWTRLESFYRDTGPSAWSDGRVPHRISTNGYLADIYAAITAAYFLDLQRAGVRNPPVVLEVGGGSGLFAWRFLNRLMRHHLTEEPTPDFTYVLTDVAADNVRAWNRIPRLRRLADDGILHFGVMHVGDRPALEGVEPGAEVPDLEGRPLVVIANYVFDAIPTDLVRVRNGEIFRELIALEAPESTDGAGNHLGGITARFESRKLREPLTDHPVINEILDGYRSLSGDRCIPVPLAAIAFVERFLESEHPFLLLAGDMGYTGLDFTADPPLHIDGYAACYTNFHMVGEIVERRGGSVHVTDGSDPQFSVGAFLKPSTGLDMPITRQAARLSLAHFTPYDAFSVRGALDDHAEKLDFDETLGWLRLARFDDFGADLCLPHLARVIDDGESFHRELLADSLLEVYRFELPEVTGEPSMDLRIAVIFLKARMYEEAVTLLTMSTGERGRDPDRLYLLAVALNRLGRPDEAERLFLEILDREAGYWGSMPGAPAARADLVKWLLDPDRDALHLDYVDLRASVAAFARLAKATHDR